MSLRAKESWALEFTPYIISYVSVIVYVNVPGESVSPNGKVGIAWHRLDRLQAALPTVIMRAARRLASG